MPDNAFPRQPMPARFESLRNLSAGGWAWEFLRRNPDYLADASRFSGTAPEILAACGGNRLIRQKTRLSAAERWGLFFFPDPSESGYEADAFWRPDWLTGIVSVQANPAPAGRPCSTYRRALANCHISHLTDPEGQEHVRIRGNGDAVQVRCAGVSLLGPAPVCLSFLVGTSETMNERYRILTAAHRIFEAPDTTRRWTRRALLLRNALIAYDCERDGLTIRQTAAMIYGKPRADAAWAAPSRAMKDEIRRARQRGRELVNGGYAELLKTKRNP